MTTEVDITQTYTTSNGHVVRLLCTDRKDPVLTVVGLVTDPKYGEEHIYTWDKFGVSRVTSSLNLVKYCTYTDFKIDEPVMVRDRDSELWKERHFAGVVDGQPSTFPAGTTSWTVHTQYDNPSPITWEQCRRPTKEELECVK